MAERALLDRLQGGCQVPIAAHAVLKQEQITMDGLIASVDGRKIVRDIAHGSVEDPCALGVRLAEKLLENGGKSILNEIYGQA
jgi:hydroxymethylbilane synthase